jgi:hypothetical protein
VADESVASKLIAEAERYSEEVDGVVLPGTVIRWLAEVAASALAGVSSGFVRAQPEGGAQPFKRNEEK